MVGVVAVYGTAFDLAWEQLYCKPDRVGAQTSLSILQVPC